MKKVFKITLKIVLGLVGMVLLAAILVPVFFKDDIRQAIDDTLAESLNATVYYDTDDFSVSLLRSFPSLSVQMGDFGIVGQGVFETDTLASVDNFELTVDLMSLFGDITVNKVQLDQPEIMVLVLEDGTANYDIAKPSEEETEEEEDTETEEASTLNVSIDKWEINKGEVVYFDQSLPFYITISGLDHSGKGDLQADLFKMVTNTSAEAVSLGYDGTEYLTDKSFNADITLDMDMSNMKFTFSDNRVSVNNFGFGFEGFVSMPEEDIAMDIQFAGQEIDMKSVLSLIPGAYEEYLEGVSASGEIDFDGFVKGTYNESSMPHVKTTLNITNGSVKAEQAPAPLEKIQTKFVFDYPSADLVDTKMLIDFSAEMADQKSSAKIDFQNLDNYQWDVVADMDLDMDKLAKVLPLEDTELRGLMQVDLQTKGRMSDVEAENWEALPTSGSFAAQGFYFSSPDLPQGFGMENVSASFNPSNVTLADFKGNAGRTDLNLSGKIENYLAFALGEDELLTGNLNFSSKLIDVDEWMVAGTDEEEEVVTEDTTALEVVRIPENIDFTLATTVDAIKYTGLSLNDFRGKVLVKEGAVILDHTTFDLLNGKFEMTGAYASQTENPSFDFDFGITELSIPSAFDAFSPIQKMVPIAKNATGNFSTNFQASGLLGSDMMPIMNSISGAGLVEIAEAAIADVKILDGIKKVTKLKGNNAGNLAQLKDVLLSMEINDGRLSVQPFNLKLGGNEAVVSGSSGLDGSLDYGMAMQVPSGQAGQAVNSLISNLTGASGVVSENLDLNIGIGGTFDDPKVKLLGASQSKGEGSLVASVKDQVKDEVDNKISEVKSEVTAQVNEAADSVKAEAKQLVEEKKEEAQKKLEKEAKNAVKNLFKKKKKNN